MRGAIDWFARNSVAANLLMMALVVTGLATAASMKTEVFPEYSLDMVTVQVPYPGAAPAEVEESICVRIEEEVHTIEGVKRVTSSASEGIGTVTLELLPEEDARRVLDDVKVRVDAIDSFPEEAEKPVVQELLMRAQVINLAVAGDIGEAALKRVAEGVRDALNRDPAISQVQLASARPYEISIEVSEEALRRHGLSFDDVANAVRRSSLDLSGGSVKTRGGEILLRTKAQAYRGPEFERLVVWTRPDGTRLHLDEVAEVVDGFEDTDQRARFNGEPCVLVQVFRVGEENALEVAAAVHDFVDRTRPTLPPGVELVTWGDQAVFLQSRLDLLVKNGLQGLALVFAVLALFLKFRLSFWVTLGIPISFLGAFAVLPQLDVSINMLSLFAFIVVLGIVVDDAIVVGESILTEQERGNGGVEGAIEGTHRVGVPVTFAVLTSVVAFLPMMFLPGLMGKFFRVIPAVVIPCLAFSWVESKLILPAHLAHGARWMERLARVPPFRWWAAFQSAISRALDRFIRVVYTPLLRIALRWRYATLALAVAALTLTVGLVAGGRVKFRFFNPIEGDLVAAQLTLPLGTSADVTAEAVARMEAAARELRTALDGGDGSVIRHYLASIGEHPFRAQQENRGIAGASAYVGSHLGEIVMELVPAEERTVLSSEVVRRWRELTGPIPGAVELVFSSDIMSAGDAINVQFAGDDMNELQAVADAFEERLSAFSGVFDVADSYRGGKQEVRLDILPGAEALGLTRLDLARQVRQAFYGEEAQRIQRGRDELKVMVRYPEEDRRSLEALDSMRIRTPDGAEVPFSSVAVAELDRSFATISRADRQRTIRVTADVDTAVANANEILGALRGEVLPDLLAAHPDVSYSFEGENREQAETVAAMQTQFALAMLAIFGLMAIPFRSYLQPLIVMLAIPFGFVGAVLGHLLLGLDVSVLSLCGLVALAGVVVNDSLVLVDFVNRERAAGVPLGKAAWTAGSARFRPVVLTSLTTFAGLTPLLLEKSVQAQFLIPMAVSLAYGVLFSTLITLFLIPASYLVLEDLMRIPAALVGLVRRRPVGRATAGA